VITESARPETNRCVVVSEDLPTSSVIESAVVAVTITGASYDLSLF